MRRSAERSHSNDSATALARLALFGSLATTAWVYVGYPALLLSVGRRTSRHTGPPSPLTDDELPVMTVVVAALDEAAVIEEKIADLRKQAYPADKLHIVVVADGSTDATPQIAERLGVVCLWEPERRGKANAVNRALTIAEGDITCLTDANCALAPGALAAIAARFADPQVGIVSGAKTVSGPGGRAAGESLYWRFEAAVKTAESDLGVTMGAPGELLGIRTSLFRPIPPHISNDDFYLTCDILDRGYKARYAGEALTTETTADTAGVEFKRRSGIAAGTWQTCFEFPQLASPRGGWLAVSFVSHRVLRNLAVPVMLPFIWALSEHLGRTSAAERTLARAQRIAYATAVVGLITDARALAPFAEFLLLNAAQLRGGFRWISGRHTPMWDKPERREWA